MENVDNIYFDICEFVHTDTVREITISFDGDLLKISEIHIETSEVWIVPSGGLAAVLRARYKNMYPMFFGVLLTALHTHDASMPIFGICLGDVDLAIEHQKSNLHELVEVIATGKYQPSRK